MKSQTKMQSNYLYLQYLQLVMAFTGGKNICFVCFFFFIIIVTHIKSQKSKYQSRPSLSMKNEEEKKTKTLKNDLGEKNDQ